MLAMLARIPQFQAFRRWGTPKLVPMNLTCSLTYRCNSRCRTCNVWKKEQADELSSTEWERVFISLGHAPYWITFSGGEPLLRADAVEIINSAYTHCRPAIINIPTNGLLPQRTVDRVAAIAAHCSDSQIVVNLSLDGWEQEHDHIRNIPGNFRRAMETYEGLHSLSAPNLTLGVHTVISRYNVDQIPELYRHVQSLSPDSYITEIAENRVELDTMGSDIAPPTEPCTRALRFLRTEIGKTEADGITRITQAFRMQYYSMVERWLREQRQLIPCYAGWASAQVSPEGEVWVCCIRAEPVGNLRQAAYDFRKVWFGEQIAPIRASVKNRECHCPLANASYTNMLCHYPSMVRVGAALVRTTLLHTRRSLSQAGTRP